ncbi:MAG: DUF1700 domain-containing protein [Clostridiales bacterium]|jgi:uncharacterized membrane protein|nr:DUF1700 domain-containing protein [Clostridiales bacterium]
MKKSNMKKSKFEKKLFKQLGSLPKAEKIKIIEYYNELYLDQKELGRSDDEIIAEWGSPSDIALKVLNEDAEIKLSENALKDGAELILADGISDGGADSKPDTDGAETPSAKAGDGDKRYKEIYERFKKKLGIGSEGAEKMANGNQEKQHGNQEKQRGNILKSKAFWIIYFALFYVTIPLTIALLAVVICIAAAVLAVFIAIFATDAGLIFGGAGGIVIGIITMFFNFNDGLLTLGASLIALGVGLLGLHIFGAVGRLFKKRKIEKKQ